MLINLRNVVLCVLVVSMFASVAEARGGRRRAKKSESYGAPAMAPASYSTPTSNPQPHYQPPTAPSYQPTYGTLPPSTFVSGGSVSQPQRQLPVLQPVAPVAGSPTILAVEPYEGGRNEVLVRGEAFGSQPGQVVLEVSGIQIGLEASAWTPNAIVAKLPAIQLGPNANVQFRILRADGVANVPTKQAS